MRERCYKMAKKVMVKYLVRDWDGWYVTKTAEAWKDDDGRLFEYRQDRDGWYYKVYHDEYKEVEAE